THIPGWKIVMPSNPLDAYGLMISACREKNPVMYLKPKALLRVRGEEPIPGEPGDDKALSKMIDAPLGDRSKWKAKWPELTDHAVKIGEGKIVHRGSRLTVVSYGRTLPLCVTAAKTLAAEGLDAEVIDLRSLWPYDWAMIKASVEKTGRVLYVNEDTEVTNFGEHLVRRTVEELFYQLQAAPKLLAGKFVPGIGLADALEAASVPQHSDIEQAMRALAAEEP
ncbi:MAG: Branched-chain alpha-keto acid dehydrogenase, component, beta subunit, partial [Myxococcaceae bacterium]|nr:Branched-chain alpha-keto acid dehydrogenase, component, beta subunit [Myxococcaceae bacterium]